jgi:glycosyltransferase involved in cell wall biosynthesis
MKNAFCAPVDIHALARFSGQPTEGLPQGIVSTATTPLIIKMLSCGREVVVYTLSLGLEQEKFYHWGKLQIHVGNFRTNRPARDCFSREIAYLCRTIKADSPSFIHAHWTYEFALGALASGIPTLVTIHDLPWNLVRHFRDRFRTVQLLMAYAVALRGKHFTAVSSDAAAHFSRYIKPGAKVTVVPNGLPDAMFEVQEPPSEIEREGFTFATVLWGWSRRKNAKAALRAFDLVRKAVPGARLLIFGDNYEEGGPAHRWALENHLADDVQFKGPLLHDKLMVRLREEVDVIVHPSLDEALSVTGLEALALRKPFIAGKSTPGMRDLLGDGEAGVLVDVRDHRAIAEAMIQLANDSGSRKKLAQAGFERVNRLFRLDPVMEQYESLYKNMLKG